MAGKKTLTLTEIPTRRGVSIIQDMAVAYGTDEKIFESDGLAVPKHGFFAASLNNFDGFPDSGTIDVGDDFVGGAYIFNEARITPTVSLKPEKGEGACLVMYDNAYATDALFTNEYSVTPCILGDNAIVRGGEHHEIWVGGNGYVEGTKTNGVSVAGSARLINAGQVSPSMFGGDTEVNLTGVDTSVKNAATELNKLTNKLNDLEREISGLISSTSDRLATDLLRLQNGNLNLTTLNNGKKRERLSKARKLKVEVEQHAGYNESLSWVYAEGAYEIMSDTENAQNTSVRATVAQKNVKTAQDVLERLRGEWEKLEDGE